MSEGFAYLDILFFAMVAAFIAFRLRSVLGRRTGHERRRPSALDPQPAPRPGEAVRNAEPRAADNVVPLPDRSAQPVGDEDDMLAGTPETGLQRIRRADRDFDPEGFVGGAKAAFGMIVEAFARADREQLRPLLSPEVLRRFVAAIEERERRGETLSTELVAISDAEIEEAELVGGRARVTVRFTSQQINVVRDSKGQAQSGDPTRIEDVVDLWTFERNTRSRDPNWQLVETRTPG